MRLALIAAVALLLAAPASAQPAKNVHIIIVVPSAYASTVTPDQAVTAVNGWMGTINAWLAAQTGKTVNYDVTVDSITESISQLAAGVDACGSASDGQSFANNVFAALNREHGYSTSGNRTMLVVLGAGGWAGHYWASPSNTPKGWPTKWGLVGDWGVEEQAGVPVACVPGWDYPMRGYSHEFVGALGMFFNGKYDTDDSIFVGDPLTATEISNLSRNSGTWLS